MRHSSLRIADLEEADLAEVHVRERVARHEGVEARLGRPSRRTSAPPPSGDDRRLRVPCSGRAASGPPSTQARGSTIAPTTWKWTLSHRRPRRPRPRSGSSRPAAPSSGCVTYWFSVAVEGRPSPAVTRHAPSPMLEPSAGSSMPSAVQVPLAGDEHVLAIDRRAPWPDRRRWRRTSRSRCAPAPASYRSGTCRRRGLSP